MPESIFTVQTPANTNEQDGVPLTLGTRFVAAVNGTIDAIRWYFPSAPVVGTINGRLYSWTSNTTGTLLSSQNFGATTPGTWNVINLPAPIPITAGTPYVAAVYTPLGEYVSTGALFALAITNGNLTATADAPTTENGKFIAGNAYPDDSFNGNGYFVDVVFTAAGGTITGSVGQSHETDISNVVGKTKQKLLSVSSEHDTAGVVGRLKLKTLGASSEADLANTVTPRKTATLGVATEVDTSRAIGSLKNHAVGVAGEVDAGRPINALAPIMITLGVAEETDSAITISTPEVSNVGLGTEPCEPWDPIWCGVLPTGAEAVTGAAVQIATEILWGLSGQRYGLCTVTLRPCRRECSDGWGGWDDWWPGVGGIGRSFGGGGPRPWWYNGMWYNICSNGCGNSCSCTMLDEAVLPAPTREVVNVMLNGVPMDPTTYRVDENRLLVRTDGQLWPLCQDMAAADTEPNTWSVTIRVGETVPAMAKRAVGELAMEYVKDCLGGECALPNDLTSLSRQGVNMSFGAPDGVTSVVGQIGLRWVNLFLQVANPNQLQQRARVYNVDRQPFRRVGTT